MVMKDVAASNGNENGREKIKMTTLQKLQAASGNTALAKFKKAAKTAVEEEKADVTTTRSRSKTTMMINQMRQFSTEAEKQRYEAVSERRDEPGIRIMYGRASGFSHDSDIFIILTYF